MIEKLQIKFILITMLSIIIISCGIFWIMVSSNVGAINEQADVVIEMIAGNSGEVPEYKEKGQDKYNVINEETKYITRFFTAIVDESGDFISVNTRNTVSVNEEEAKEIVGKITKTAGYYDRFRYKQIKIDVDTLYVFVDCTQQLGSMEYTVRKSINMIFIGWGLVLIILLLASKRILKPITESVEKQKQFVTNASHELKTPLAVINADIDVLEMTIPEENEWVFSIKKQVNRLDVLVRSLLTLASVEEGKDKLNVSEFSFTEVINEEINDFKSLIKDKKIEFDDSKDILLRGDKELIKQAIIILLDNAIKYTTDDGTIKIEVEQRGKEVKFEIANTCENPDDIDTRRLFDRFYRNDKSRNSKNKGYGIGLSIAKSIVDMHKGRIGAFVNEKKMMCFRIILPKGK